MARRVNGRAGGWGQAGGKREEGSAGIETMVRLGAEQTGREALSAGVETRERLGVWGGGRIPRGGAEMCPQPRASMQSSAPSWISRGKLSFHEGRIYLTCCQWRTNEP